MIDELIELFSIQNSAEQVRYRPNFLLYSESQYNNGPRLMEGALLLSPRFSDVGYGNKSYRDQGYVDTLMIPYNVTMEQDDIERISSVRFRFGR